MSQEDIDRLVAERSLAREGFTDQQVVGFWARASASLADAHLRGISADGAFQHLYTAAFQATIAVLAAHGLRVKGTAHHYRAFFALQRLEDGLRAHGLLFDELRAIRHDSVYEPQSDEVDMNKELAQAFTRVPPAFAALRDSIIRIRPNLAQRLVPLR
jgi:hypothetical protein